MRRGRLLIMLAFILLLGVAAVYLVLRRIGTPTAQPEGTPAAPDIAFIVIAFVVWLVLNAASGGDDHRPGPGRWDG